MPKTGDSISKQRETALWITEILSRLDRLQREVAQRAKNQKRLDRLTKRIAAEYRKHGKPEKRRVDFSALEQRLRPQQQQIDRLHDCFRPTEVHLSRFSLDLHRGLTVCVSRFPRTTHLREEIDRIGTVSPVAAVDSWPQRCDDLAALRELLTRLAAELNRKGAGKSVLSRRRDERISAVKSVVKQWHEEGLSYQQIAERLGDRPRPPHVSWRDDAWPVAYKRHPNAVKTWLSRAANP